MTPEIRNTIVAMCRNGRSNPEIVRALGVPERSVRRVRSEHGIPPYVRSLPGPSADDIARITSLRLQGYSLQAIASEFEFSKTYLEGLIRKHRIPRAEVPITVRGTSVPASKPKAVEVEEPVVIDTGPEVFVSASGIRAVRQFEKITLPFVSILFGGLLPAEAPGAPSSL